jgi:hypothetical protein
MVTRPVFNVGFLPRIEISAIEGAFSIFCHGRLANVYLCFSDSPGARVLELSNNLQNMGSDNLYLLCKMFPGGHRVWVKIVFLL